VLTDFESSPDKLGTQLYTLWAYYKTAAVLDHLRVTMGEQAFDAGLTAYVKQCGYVGCSPNDFRRVMEQTSGRDLAPFFKRWVWSDSRPRVTVSFEPTADGAKVQLEKSDDDRMSVQLWVRFDDGRIEKRHIDLDGRVTARRLEVGPGVRGVALSPRHDLLVEAVSAIAGDIDFDGETDGFDILRCARLVGEEYKPSATGLWATATKFDPRCDVNGNLRIDDDDLKRLGDAFGKTRAP
jgi:hypothetical protein